MKFSMLLFVLGLKLRFTALLSEQFRKMVRKKDFVLVIRTADALRARTYYFKNGKVRSARRRDKNDEISDY